MLLRFLVLDSNIMQYGSTGYKVVLHIQDRSGPGSSGHIENIELENADAKSQKNNIV